MSKPDLGKLIKIGAGIGKIFAPGAVGSVLDVVTENIDDDDDPKNETSLKEMAETIDHQSRAILALHERLKKVEARQ